MQKPLYIITTHWNPSLHYSSLKTEVEVSSDSLAPTYLHRRPKTLDPPLREPHSIRIWHEGKGMEGHKIVAKSLAHVKEKSLMKYNDNRQ